MCLCLCRLQILTLWPVVPIMQMLYEVYLYYIDRMHPRKQFSKAADSLKSYIFLHHLKSQSNRI